MLARNSNVSLTLIFITYKFPLLTIALEGEDVEHAI